MSGFNYGRSRATAERLIARFGQPATLRKVANTGTSYAPTQTPTDTTITVLDLKQRVRDASGTLTGQTMRTLLVSTAAGVAPEKRDAVAIGISEADVIGTTPFLEISEVRPLSPGGTTLMYEADIAD